MINYGKKFESEFKRQWVKQFPNSFIYRLPDQQSGYYNSSNPCDFITYYNRTLCLLELKTHKGKSFPLENLHQFNSLYSIYNNNVDGIEIGVIIWLYSLDKVLYVPINEIAKMKKDNIKSINLSMLENKVYNIIDVPSIKKRTFMTSDYSVLFSYNKK